MEDLETNLRIGDHVLVLGWVAIVYCNPAFFVTTTPEQYDEVMSECIINRFAGKNTIRDMRFHHFAVCAVNGQIKMVKEYDKCRAVSNDVGEYIIVEKVATRWDNNVVLKWKKKSAKRYPYPVGSLADFIDANLKQNAIETKALELEHAHEINQLPNIFAFIKHCVRQYKLSKFL